MTKFLIGAGGWTYFRVPGMKSLEAYSKAFDFVEVNSTFYQYPSLKEVELWRRRVPPRFEFSVRCHRDLTQKYKLEPIDEAYDSLNKMIMICKILGANILHIQTPPGFKFSKAKIKSVHDLFSSAKLKGTRISWEIRRVETKPFNPALIALMKDYNMIHCVDLSREKPAFESDILYTRLFGKGVDNIWQFTDDELKEIDKNVSPEVEIAAMCFHGAKMYKDAARYKVYKQTRKFKAVTKSTGLDSLKEVLMEDAKFPVSREELIKHQGWKVIDLTEEKRVHASKLLKKLPENTYNSVEEVIQSLR